jgi:5-methylcytosine-specific restriction endonuclease McrA
VAKRICSIPECQRFIEAQGLCSMHYQRWRKHGSFEKPGLAATGDLPILGLYKGCRRCGLVKPTFEFHTHKQYGWQSQCRGCRHAAYQADAVAIRARTLARYYDDPERHRSAMRRRYQANPEPIKAYISAWQKANPTKVKEYFDRRRCWKYEAPVNDLTHSDWLAILEEYGNRCFYCGTQERLTRDHVMPLSRGGSHTRVNIVPACWSCNSRKGALTTEEYLARKGGGN